MNQQAAFKMYFGLNLHLTTLPYDLLKYGINTKVAQAKYDSLTQEQLFRFDWLASKFPDMQDLVFSCIGSQFNDVSVQFGLKQDILDSYIKFKSRREALSYTIKGEVIKHESENNVPLSKLIFKYFIGNYSPEYVILLSHGTDKLENLYDCSNLSWAKDKILKLIKYKSFFNATKYLPLIENQ